jgi:tRNA-Thr(GGU) m(6)t(6)A37 methyltransferase TsaA
VSEQYVVKPVGWVESTLRDRDAAPKQGDEGAPDARIRLEPTMLGAARNLEVGTEVILLTWLDRADRSVLTVHPRDDASRPVQGVFSTRSADRPNPIGMHRVRILSVDDTRIHVRGLEALDGTPVVDIKPVLGSADER